MFCSKCGTENKDDARFCSGCGNVLQQTAPPAKKFCSSCGAEVPPGGQFCDKCGASLGQAVAPSAPRPKAKRWRWLWNFILWGVIGFILSFGSIKVTSIFQDNMPFIGLWAGTAVNRATSFVNSNFPEFNEAETYVSPVFMNMKPVYVVDFVLNDPPSGLSVVVSRDLNQIWPYEYMKSE